MHESVPDNFSRNWQLELDFSAPVEFDPKFLKLVSVLLNNVLLVSDKYIFTIVGSSTCSPIVGP